LLLVFVVNVYFRRRPYEGRNGKQKRRRQRKSFPVQHDFHNLLFRVSDAVSSGKDGHFLAKAHRRKEKARLLQSQALGLCAFAGQLAIGVCVR
jgi:hypothetical protein